MAKSILVVEDNRDMRAELSRYLQTEGYTVHAVASTEDGIDAVDEHEFDLGIIDINLPGKSGFDMIAYIREEGHSFPVLALTARDGIEDRLKGFRHGANDYIIKPFDLRELAARVRAHLVYAGSGRDDEVITTKHFSLDPMRLECRYKGAVIELTQLEIRIMQILLKNNHTLVKLDDLITYAWGEDSATNPPVRIHIANLRKKIGDSDFRMIRTIPGTGYIFHDPVERGAL